MNEEKRMKQAYEDEKKIDRIKASELEECKLGICKHVPCAEQALAEEFVREGKQVKPGVLKKLKEIYNDGTCPCCGDKVVLMVDGKSRCPNEFCQNSPKYIEKWNKMFTNPKRTLEEK